jgi:hypothetical protein
MLKCSFLFTVSLCLALANECQAQFHTNVITTPGGAFNFTVDGTLAKSI